MRKNISLSVFTCSLLTSLNIKQVESGKLVLKKTDFDLGNEVEGLVDMFSVQCLNQNLEIVLDFSGMSYTFICNGREPSITLNSLVIKILTHYCY